MCQYAVDNLPLRIYNLFVKYILSIKLIAFKKQLYYDEFFMISL